MLDALIPSFFVVLHSTCVIAVLAYGIIRSPVYQELSEGQQTIRTQMVLIAVFSLFSLYAAFMAIPIAGGLVALAHVGQMVAGLLAGPVVGTGVGLVVAGYRISLGGALVVPSAISAVLVGLLAGLYYQYRRGKAIQVKEAVLFTIAVQILARLISLAFSPDFAQALERQKYMIFPMVFGHAAAVGLFIYIVNTLWEERKIREVKARIESELRLARDIQLSLVPKTFPPFPEVKEFDVYAILEPAKEVGGDLYDFFFLDDEHFCFVIGDVSGKGVPAALFMSGTRTLLKAHAEHSRDPAQLLAKVNNDLCRGNDTSMFVTLFCGILHVPSGHVIYANAGHNPPCLRQSDGSISWLPAIKGIALGVMEDMTFQLGQFQLQAGDTLITYTDGVTEAMDESEAWFGNDLLVKAVMTSADAAPKAIIDNIRQAVGEFVGLAEQSDDITMLVLSYRQETQL